MTDNGAQQKPSETALFAALRRALANKEYNNNTFGPDCLAEAFLPPHFRFFLRFKKIRENTKNKLDGVLPGLNEYMIARTAYFDTLFVDALNNGIPQIVLLGAGYDSRAYRFEKLNRSSKIFELDIAATQNRKKNCLKGARIDIPERVTLVPINFNEESLRDVLEKAGYNSREKTQFIWEGVSYYLDADSVDATLEFVSHYAHKDSTIAFDYAITLTEVNMHAYFGAMEFAQAMKEHHASEELTFSIDERNITSFLEHRDLKLVEHLNKEEIERRFLSDASGLLLGQTTGHFRFVSASILPNRSA